MTTNEGRPDINTALFQAVTLIGRGLDQHDVYEVTLASGFAYANAFLAHIRVPTKGKVSGVSKLLPFLLRFCGEQTDSGVALAATIMQGCPGSGKSTVVRELVHETSREVVSADHFFEVQAPFNPDSTAPTTVYVFDPTLLGQAHTFCRLKAIDFIRKGQGVVIDNTHCGPGDLAETVEYVLRAFTHVARVDQVVPLVVVVTLEPDADVEAYAAMCASRNTHGVSLANVRRMALNLANDARVRNPLTAYRARR